MPNKLSTNTKKTMSSRIITGLLLAVVAVPLFFLGGWWFVSLIFFALIMATTEFLRAAKVSRVYWLIYFFTYLAVISLTFWVFIKNNIKENISQGLPYLDLASWEFERGFIELEVSTLGVIVILITTLAVLIFDRNFQFEIATYMFMMIILVGIGFQAFLMLRFLPMNHSIINADFNPTTITSSFLALYVVLGTIANDIGAYFIGVLFGKHKMAPRVSPNKTWEGFLGGFVMSFIVSFGFAAIASATGNPLIPLLDLNSKTWYLLVIFSLIMPLFANIGDLFFSVLKRNFAIKDYGKMLRGHGGMLDRLDSLLVVSLAISTLITLTENGFGII